MSQKRQWHGVEWSMFIVLSGATLLGFLNVTLHAGEFGNVPIMIMYGGLLLAYGLPLLFWRPSYVNAMLFPLAVLATNAPLQIYLSWMKQEPFTIINAPIMIIGFLTDRKNAWWTAPVFTLIVPLAYLLVLHVPSAGDLFGEVLNAMLLFAIGLSLQRVVTSNVQTEKLLAENQRQYQLIHEQNNVLEQYANQIEQLTLAEERSRLARELHDTVGHTFTSVIMGMDAVAYLIETSPDKAKEKLDVLRKVTRSGLDEVRRSIHQMAPKGDDLLLSVQLSRLAQEFAVHTGTQVRMETLGTEYELPKMTKLTLIRCLQESLTNAKRHGQAAAVEVALTYREHEVSLTIEDDGVGTEQLQIGFGISAMQERIAALQGQLHVRSSPAAGTTVSCTIPAKRLPAF
ncbi:sensor histidine kinase [Paenibacillus athensensis]|uniref:histidine kinase n=1 Tax=Paenibacillus athensensis TaxID=1967502 RepID=A0A4Y8Q636_9BACL|nr:sensor histidine kinase [Paenibacillus athensensis]MCD1259578.1 sensor histidine kinase [Paenibacillus athensensis]